MIEWAKKHKVYVPGEMDEEVQEHCPKSSIDTYILMFEPYTLQSKGD